jgi:hypothetical protein
LAVERLESRLLLAADFGDAPISTGVSHEAIGPPLGALRDVDSGAMSTLGAVGDGSDDDGVLWGVLRVGQTGVVITRTPSRFSPHDDDRPHEPLAASLADEAFGELYPNARLRGGVDRRDRESPVFGATE